MSFKWPYLICVFLCAGTSFYLFYPWIENFFVFFPEKTLALTPKDLHLDHEEIHFSTEDGMRLHGWLFPLEGEPPIILFFHGNAGNISHRLDNVRLLLDHGLQVFIFDYRGYGKSAGTPSETGLYADGLAAYDYLVKKRGVTPGQIVLFGRSIGAAVAIDLALKREVGSLIMEGAFTSTRDMAKSMGLFRLISYFLPPHYNAFEKIPRVDTPKLIIHGEKDEIVPFAMGQKLFKAAKMPKYFYPLKRAGHNDTYVEGGEEYFRVIAAFAKNGRI
jgi:fermentation-respiration switch protein FrsA (DUF1100 family)